ncbi:hypothetical protein CHS0354_026114 [Potamilus streckersoni]|uniref:Uncharacterized protein n=1 Tax=Potamilus streckersoni TaxID=2493646 RepID=A0AAE0VNU3_9BIVA|nr:hypothetical protein CHS0354_026114 [Potamilus streckersoni]
MASTCISTNERTNIARLCWIVVDVFRDILWHLLTDEISPTILPRRVLCNYHKLGNLNKDIRLWLCNSSSASPIIPASKDFDVTSLYTLIRNLCNLVPVPTNGWGQEPPPIGGNLGDEVERLMVFINSVYGHAKEGHVNTIDYSDLCREMKTCVTSLDAFFGGNCDFVGWINSILTSSMDKVLQDTYIDKMQEIAKFSDEMTKVKQQVGRNVAETTCERQKPESSFKRGLEGRVERLEKESIEAKQQWDSLRNERQTAINKMEQLRIIDSSQMILHQHRSHASKNFVETRAYIRANEILRQHRRLIITGKSGQGKSYMAQQLLMKIIGDDPNIKPLILSTVEQWKSLVDSSAIFGIIVDDMCGKICMNEGELMKWRKESTYMQTLIENGKHVVIFTMKSYFIEKILMTMQSRPLFSPQIILNLDKIRLKFAEKNEFAKTYLKWHDLSAADVSAICKTGETTVGFPQMCKTAEMIKNKSRLFGLFSKPREIILEQINHFRMEDNMSYGCLVLVLLSKGKFNVESIMDIADDREKKENIASSIFSSCGISDVVPLKVFNTVRSLQGTYLLFDTKEESYSFAHDSIEDAVFCSYLEFFPEQTLLYCPLQLICKRCTIKHDSKDSETTSQDDTLILQPFCQAHLINRIRRALREGIPTDFSIVSEANIWTCKNFRNTFFAEFKEIHFIADKENNSLLVHAANVNNRDLIDELLNELDNIPEEKKKHVAQFLTKSAVALCAHKDTYLIEKICKNGHLDVNDILPNSIQNGSVEAIEFILERGADVKYRSKNGENLLHSACLHGRLDLVKFLHSKDPNLVNELDCADRSVSLSVAAGGRVEILEFLLTVGLKPMYTDHAGWNLLHYAFWNGNKAMAEHLVDNYSKLLHSVTKEGLSVFMCAAFGGIINIFSNIYQSMVNMQKVNKSSNAHMKNDIRYLTRKTNDQHTLLHMSCIRGGLDMTKYLVQTYPTMISEVDNMNTTPAHHAASSGNIAVLSYLIDCGTDPWCKTSEEETLLHRACLSGQLEMSKYLVQTYPTMLHEVDNMKRTPAHKAAYSGNIALLCYLIDSGTDPWCKTSNEETLLHRACLSGQLEMSKHLVQTYPPMFHEVDNMKRTPAHHAASSGNIVLLRYLIDCGTDPWCKTSQEETLLHRACLNGQLEMSKYLVQTYPTMLHDVDNMKTTPAHNAASSSNIALLTYLADCGTNPWCKTCEEETLLHRACLSGQLEMSKHLAQTYPRMLHEVDNMKKTPAHNAAESGNIALLSYLIDRGTDPWCKTSEEETLLHSACIRGQLEMSKYLVHTYPSMVYEMDNMKTTPAHNAAESGNIDLLKYLVDCGTDPWWKSESEETLLHRACLSGQFEMCKHLVQTYPKMLHEADKMKRKPAHKAAYSGNIVLLSYLIHCGTNPWCKTSENETLLHRACLSGQLEMSKHLVQTYPTMLNEADHMKATPAHKAAESGNTALLSYLIYCGTNPWYKTSEDETLLHRACRSGQLEIIKHLALTYPTMLHEVDKLKTTPAHLAAESGNIAALIYIIDCGTDPWCKTYQEETLLHRACLKGQLEMSKYLIQNYLTMLHVVDSMNRPPAHHAAESGNIALLSYLIDCGTDPLCKSSAEETLLHRACLNGQLEMSKHLVQRYPTMLHGLDNMMTTPAHYAADYGNIALLSYLIDCGTDPWCKTSGEETLLHKACLSGQLEMSKHLIQTYPTMLLEVDNTRTTSAHNAAETDNIALLSYLIDCGTDPWCKTSQEDTLLHRACLSGQFEMSRYLVQSYPSMVHEVDTMKRTPAHNAASSGNVALLRYLIDCGTDPWCKTSEGETLLHRACLSGQLEMSKHLVQSYPTMLHEVDNMKTSPAHDVSERGNIALLSYLIDFGTDPWCITSEKETLLHRACLSGQFEMSKHLVQTYPAMLHEVDNMRRTPTHNAASSGNIALLTYLIDCGTDPWYKTSEGETLLHRACISGQIEMSKHLIQSYPSMLHEVDNMKRTPAHHAAESGHTALLSYLIYSGTDPWCKTFEEQTLLHRACLKGRLEMSKHLVQSYPTMLHEVDTMKQTPAHNSAESGNISLLGFLIDCGTSPWLKTSEEETLLDKACLNGQFEMSKYLVQTYPTMLHEVDNMKRTPAHSAAECDNISLLCYLIDCGIDPWCKTYEGETLLHRACLGGQLEMSKHLVKMYPKMIHDVDYMKRTPAHLAAESGNIALLNYLIDCGTYPWCKTKENENLLHKACLSGQLEMSKHLVQTYPRMLNELDSMKRTPAHKAAYGGNITVLMYLIDSGTDPWCKSSEDETLLHRACLSGQIEMTKHLVQTYPAMLHEVDNMKRAPAHHAAESGNITLLTYLIHCGTDPWCITSEEETLLHRACLKGQLEMSKHLVQTYPTMLHAVDIMKTTPAHNATESGNIALLCYLIDCGTDAWCKTSEEETLLHRACLSGQLEMSKYLVQTYPGLLHELDNMNTTPDLNAASSGNIALLSYLTDCGTDPWCKSSGEETLLHRACLSGQLEMSKHLAQTYPTMLHEVDNMKRTSAHHAAYSGNIALLSYIIDCGTDPWCKTSEDETLLHRACLSGELEMSKYLVHAYPTMLHEVDNMKRTPAHHAATSGNVALLSYIIDCGTDPWCKTSDEETLLHRACLKGQLEMCKHLVHTYPTMLHELDNMKRTPAHNAAESGNIAVLNYLIDCGRTMV